MEQSSVPRTGVVCDRASGVCGDGERSLRGAPVPDVGDGVRAPPELVPGPDAGPGKGTEGCAVVGDGARFGDTWPVPPLAVAFSVRV